MPAIQEKSLIRKKTFEGTEAEFDIYRKKRPVSNTKRFIIEYEKDCSEETEEINNILPEPHILDDSHREFLLKRLEKSDQDIQEGRVEKATPQMFDRLRGIAEK